MNIIEAIKKAKEQGVHVSYPEPWHYTLGGMGYVFYSTSITPGLVNPEWLLGIIGGIDGQFLLSDKWEVAQRKVTITPGHFWNAYGSVLKEEGPTLKYDRVEFIKRLAVKLGLEG